MLNKNFAKLALGIFITLLSFNLESLSQDKKTSAPISNYYPPNLRDHLPQQGFTLLETDSCQQTTEYTCGPAAALTLTRYYGMKGDEMTIAKEMGTSTTKGTTPEQMAAWLNKHGFSASFHEYGNLDTLRNNLKKQIPTLVEWSDWGGHWVLVVGYDTRNTETISDDTIIFADPYDRYDDKKDGLTCFNAERFYYMWYDALLFGKVMKRVYINAKLN